MLKKRNVIALSAIVIIFIIISLLLTSCCDTSINGKSAYDIAVENGYSGSETEWIQSLIGKDGEPGKSAYEIAVEKGYTGSEDEWLLSLIGQHGQDGKNGKSAYDLAVENGYDGTLTEWLTSLIGKSGEKGDRGATGTGISEIYVNEKGELIITLTDNTVHNIGKIVGEDGQNGINGADGQNGKDGEDGKDGTNGIDGQDGKDGRGIYDISLNNAGELIITLSDNTVYNLGIITGADGKDGTDGKDGENGKDGTNGIDGQDGKDGRGIYDISLNNAGELIITLSDNTVYNLGTITGADGKDGTDGKDGENGKDGTNGVDGKDGRGIEKVDLVDETLIIYYTDGSVQNVETVIGTPAASDEYTVAFVADGKIVSIENYSSADSDINVPNVPEKDGYIGRWENYTLAVGDLTVNAIYTPDVYELDVSMIGNYGKINGAGNYYFGETVSISVEVYPGYEFIGWYENDVLISDEVNYSFTMPDNDISYTAKFTLQKELLPFEFTISESGCTITGVTNSMATELIIPDYVIRVDDGALSECKELTSLTLPFGDKPIWMYFSDTAVSVPSTLKELTFSEFSEGVTEICASALEGCNALTDIFLPSTITEIGNNVFESCADAKLHISNLETWCSVNSESQIYPISEIVLDGNILTDIIIPDGVARIGVNTFASYMNATKVVIPESVLLIGANAFNGNGNLNYIEIDYGVIMIGNFAFSSCGSIENVVLPDSVTTLGNSVFSGSKLQSIVLSEGMDSIAWGTFNYCSDLKQIVIPDSITYVSENAFNYCNALSKVYYEGSQTDWDNITIDENNGGLINAVKYYYSENEPLEAGNYWHYAEDGITPVEW